MVLYNCPRCGFETKLRANMKRHLSRKIKCQIKLENVSIDECFRTILNEEIGEVSNSIPEVSNIDTIKENKQEPAHFECSYCSKIFSKKNNFYRHLKHYCREKDLYDKMLSQENEINNLKKENELLKSSTKIHNQNIQNIQNIQNNIIINAFGKENLDYIKKDFIHELIKDGPYASVQKLIKYIHFNPNHKENHNVKIPNKRDKFGMIFDGEKWQMRNKQNMINAMAGHAYDIIADHCEGMNNKKYEKFCEDFENRELNCIKRINLDTELVILNGQKEIGLN